MSRLSCLVLLLLLIAILCIALSLGYQALYAGRIYPGITVLDTALGGLSREQAEALLNRRLERYSREVVNLRYGGRVWPATRSELGWQYDVRRTVDAAFALGNSAPLPDRLLALVGIYRNGSSVPPSMEVDQVRLLAYLNRLAAEIDRPPLNATVRVEGNRAVVVPSQAGVRLNMAATAQRLTQALLKQTDEPLDLVVEEVPPVILEKNVQEAAATATSILAEPLVLVFKDVSWSFEGGQVISRTVERDWPLTPERLAGMLVFKQKMGADGLITLQAGLDEEQVAAFVKEIASQINRPVQDARLERDPSTGRLVPLVTSQEGRTVLVAEAVQQIMAAAPGKQRRLALPVRLEQPKVAIQDIPNMGIKELVAQGTSFYKPSSAERVHNIRLAASRLHGVVIPPGAIFSFNAALGPVTAETGYREGYAIIGDYTVRDIGGGVCQVATTFFRAVFFGGYEVVEWHPHAYRIRRYEQGGYPLGLDATVYEPTVDFKFRNDGPSYLLVQAAVDQSKGMLTFSFYGTKPGWTVAWQGPTLENEVPHGPRLPDVADPNLPKGTRILVQPAENGITATIQRIVKRGNQVVRTDTFKSRYRPSQEQWIVGTKER